MRIPVIGGLLALLGRCALLPGLPPDPERLCRQAGVEASADEMIDLAVEPDGHVWITICERRRVIARDADGNLHLRTHAASARCRLPARSLGRGELSVDACAARPRR